MPANIMQNFSFLTPKKDFFDSFVAPLLLGQEMATNKLAQEQTQIQNQYLPQKYEAEILGQELSNQEAQAALPYAAPSAEAEMIAKLLLAEQRQIQNQFMPQEQQMKLQQHQLMNAVKNMQIQKYAAEIERLNNPEMQQLDLRNAPGVAGQIGWANYLNSIGDAEGAEQIRKSIGGAATLGQRQWSSLPEQERQDILAKGRAWGIDAAEMQDRVINGETLADIAKFQAEKQGVSYDEMINRDPIYLATTAARTAAQKREAFNQEAQYLTNTFTQWMEPYIDPLTLMSGVPTKQLTDMVSGITDEEEAAKFVAATMIYPELVGARGRALGMDLGIEAMHELQDASMGNIKAIKAAITPEIWSRAQQLANETIGESSRFANSILINPEKHAKEVNEKQELSDEDIDAKIAALKEELGE